MEDRKPEDVDLEADKSKESSACFEDVADDLDYGNTDKQKPSLPESLPAVSITDKKPSSDESAKTGDSSLSPPADEKKTEKEAEQLKTDVEKYLADPQFHEMRCVKKMPPMIDLAELFRPLVVRSLLKVEDAGGQEGLDNTVAAANSELWLNGSDNRMRQVSEPDEPRLRHFEIYKASTDEAIQSLQWSVLPQRKPVEKAVPGSAPTEAPSDVQKQSNRAKVFAGGKNGAEDKPSISGTPREVRTEVRPAQPQRQADKKPLLDTTKKLSEDEIRNTLAKGKTRR